VPPDRTPGRPAGAAPRRWYVVLPVKGGADAKSRLGGHPVARRTLALAMAVDCLEAVTRTPGVAGTLVVTDDDAAARAARDLGARVVRPGPVPPGRRALDAAVTDGLCAAAALAEDGDGDGATTGVAVLLADLPALRPEDLAVALRAAADALDDGATAVLVPDAAGTGTCLQAARRAADVPVAYGTGSAARHERGGARRLALDVPRLRRDVDVADDLRAARVLGVGRRTAAALDGAAHDVGLRGRAS